ncbi:MAG: hypothetical protein ABIB43_01435 [archaeon]
MVNIPLEYEACTEGFEKSPEQLDTDPLAESVQEVDLHELPLGTIIQFHGSHPDSKYLSYLCGLEEDKQIKLWLKGQGNPAVTSIENMVSTIHYNPFEQLNGVMKIGKTYILPTFNFKPDDKEFLELSLDGGGIRIEPYTKILIKKPN